MQNLISLFIACVLIIVVCACSAVIYAQPRLEIELAEVAIIKLSELDRRVEKVEVLALDNYTRLTRLHGIGIGVSFVIIILQVFQMSGVTIKKR